MNSKTGLPTTALEGYGRKMLLAAVCLMTATGAQAQIKPQGLTSQPNQTDSALTAETRRVFISISNNTLKAARLMPEASYGFKPGDGARTFGELVAHIANVQSTLCGNMNGQKPATMPAKHESKEAIAMALVDSVNACQIAFTELSAENANKMVDTPVGKLTHLAALVYIITHESEEYGQLEIYLRLNKIAPPTSDQAKAVL